MPDRLLLTDLSAATMVPGAAAYGLIERPRSAWRGRRSDGSGPQARCRRGFAMHPCDPLAGGW